MSKKVFAMAAGIPAFVNLFSINFDGVDEYVTMGDISDLNFDGLSPFSVNAWVKTSSSSNQTIISKEHRTGNFNGWLFRLNSSGLPEFLLLNDVAPVNFIQIRSASTSVNDGAWHNVAFTYDGSQDAAGTKIYIDNASVSLTTLNDSLSATAVSTAPAQIAAVGSPTQEMNFNGNIDEVSVFDKELSSGEISSIYNSGKPTDLSKLPVAPNVLAWWRMGDKASFPTIPDQVGSNDGAMINMLAEDIVNDIP